jgi:chorismate synthase
MSFNTFGHLFRFTTWGESHGPALGVVVDGCPPGITLTPEIIQRDLDRRKPGQSKYTTHRPALEGLFGDPRQVPSGPCRFHL